MTNTIYFHNTLRDDVSTTTEEEETPPTSNRYTHQQGLNPVDDNNVDWTPSGEGGKWEYSNLKVFSFNELKTATINFYHGVLLDGDFGIGRVFKGWIDENKLTATKPGKGFFGSVFKGWIDENKPTKPGVDIAVAIKRIGYHSEWHVNSWQVNGRFQRHDEWLVNSWQPEVKYLGRLYHPNLVRLLGYCAHNRERLLVYEFMPRGSLAGHLSKNVSTPLSWSVRMKIALGAAKGLAFLHSAPINVIHRDFTSSNILLDKDYNAKLADFGLAMDGPTGDETDVDTGRIYGTIGYVAPEYIATGHLTAKCDVYAFGVVLLEMLCGRRVIDICIPSVEEVFLVTWAEPYLNDKHKVYCVADSRLEGQYSLEGFQKAANLALVCLSGEAMSRPNMDEVVKVLGEL